MRIFSCDSHVIWQTEYCCICSDTTKSCQWRCVGETWPQTHALWWPKLRHAQHCLWSFPVMWSRVGNQEWLTLRLDTCSSRANSSLPPRGSAGICLTSLLFMLFLLSVWLKDREIIIWEIKRNNNSKVWIMRMSSREIWENSAKQKTKEHGENKKEKKFDREK